MGATALFESCITSLPLIRRGKVRDIYEIDDKHILIVATDRLSAFDVVMPTAIPGKGRVLTEVADFWFDFFKDLIPNHLSGSQLSDVLPDATERRAVENRAIIARKLEPLPVEAVVRGYLIGSGWKDYRQSGTVCGIILPSGMRLAEQLSGAVYTPSSKARAGEHDVNIDFNETVKLLGKRHAERVREVSLDIYNRAAKYALQRGIIIADTKFEFGLDGDDRLVLMDEVLTPDSSRFWPTGHYQPGINPVSFDKQYVRDYLETLDWNKLPPAPTLPDEVIRGTAEKYREVQRRLTR